MVTTTNSEAARDRSDARQSGSLSSAAERAIQISLEINDGTAGTREWVLRTLVKFAAAYGSHKTSNKEVLGRVGCEAINYVMALVESRGMLPDKRENLVIDEHGLTMLGLVAAVLS